MKKLKFIKFEDVHKEWMKDKKFREEYERLQPEFEIIHLIMEYRIKHKVTQAELAKKIGTKQSAISRLESGTYNPSLEFLQKVAKGLDRKLVISFAKN